MIARFDPLGPDAGPSRSPARRGVTLVECLVIAGIVALLIGLLLPARRTASRAARRMQCASNMHNIGLGLFGYEQSHHALPIGRTEDADGRPLHDWRTLILPYMDHEALYNSLNLSKSWDDPANAEAMATEIGVFHCPELPNPKNMTTYLGIATPDGCFPPGRPLKSEEFTDGRSTTLMVIEGGAEHAAPWMAPVDADERLILGLGPSTKSNHRGGMNALFADGADRFLSDQIAPEIRRIMITVSGHDQIPQDLY
ncbi:DUF1559 domain-containing protein [Tundrisphaera sp. TA3]|uniref:DUF1559 family PulG-like putative transporter n=1 Tax=Tundrisphaera sp. TA3 TaxID=3435775 RepID=UPI003EB8B9BC